MTTCAVGEGGSGDCASTVGAHADATRPAEPMKAMERGRAKRAKDEGLMSGNEWAGQIIPNATRPQAVDDVRKQ